MQGIEQPTKSDRYNQGVKLIHLKNSVKTVCLTLLCIFQLLIIIS